MDKIENKNFQDILNGLKTIGKIKDFSLFGGMYQIKYNNDNLSYINSNNSFGVGIKQLTNGININLGIRK